MKPNTLLNSGLSRHSQTALSLAVVAATATMLPPPTPVEVEPIPLAGEQVPTGVLVVQPTSKTPIFDQLMGTWYADLSTVAIIDPTNASVAALAAAATRVPNQRNTVKLRAAVLGLSIADAEPKFDAMKNNLAAHIDAISKHELKGEFGRHFSHTRADESAAAALYTAITNAIANPS